MSESDYGQYAGIVLRPAWEEGAAQDIKCLSDNARFISRVGAWRTYEFASSANILHEEGGGPYTYQLHALLGKGLVVLVAHGRPVVEYLVSEQFMQANGFREVIVDVDGLADDVANGIPYSHAVDSKDSASQRKTFESIRYILNSIHARTPGLAESIRSLSFYGENIASNSLYRDHRKFFNIMTCGLRRANSKEIAQIKSDGTLTFQVHTRWLPQRLSDIKHMMGYVVACNRVVDAIGAFRSTAD